MHIKIILPIVITTALVGCSSTKSGGSAKYTTATHPPAVLVKDAQPADLVKVEPTANGKGVAIGVDVFSLIQDPRNYTWGEWATVAASAAASYFMYDEFVAGSGSQKNKKPKVTATDVGVRSGNRAVTIGNFSGNFNVRIEDLEEGLGVITVNGTQLED